MTTQNKFIFIALLIILLLAGGIAFALTRNNNSNSNPNPTDSALSTTALPTQTESTAVSPSATAMATTSASPSAAATVPAVTGCTSSNLAASLSNGNGAAGTYYYTLNLKNTGAMACTYSGPTTISLLDSSANVLATVNTGTAPAATLQPGQALTSTIGFPAAANYTQGTTCKAGVVSMAIYPPMQTSAVTITNLNSLQPGFTNYACTNFSVTALKP